MPKPLEGMVVRDVLWCLEHNCGRPDNTMPWDEESWHRLVGVCHEFNFFSDPNVIGPEGGLQPCRMVKALLVTEG